MSSYDDWFARKGDRSSGAGTERASEPPAIGKTSLVQLRFGPNAARPTEPNKLTLTEQLVPIQTRGAASDDAVVAGALPSGGGGMPLPTNVRSLMETVLAGDFAAVRVHISSSAAAIGARAFTRGTDLFFAPGAYDSTSPQGLELLGHELTHVVQQAQGRVPVNAQIGGAPANTDASLEHEADELGAKAASAASAAKHAGGTPGPVVPPPIAPADHGPAQLKAAPEADHGAPPAGPYLDELEGRGAESLSAEIASGPPIQRQPTKPKQREYVRFKIVVSRE